MDQLQLPFAQRLVKEVHLAGHVGAGIVVGDDEFAAGRWAALAVGYAVADVEVVEHQASEAGADVGVVVD